MFIHLSPFTTLIGETFARETFANPKTRKFFWINLRDFINRRNFARYTFANGEIEKILRDKLSQIAIFSFEKREKRKKKTSFN